MNPNDNASKAPNGMRDEFLSRNTINPNEGNIYFRNEEARLNERIVNFELKNGKIIAQGTFGK
jgi:hypothetical protein